MKEKFIDKAWEVIELFQKEMNAKGTINVSDVLKVLQDINLYETFEKSYQDRRKYIAIDDMSDFFENYLWKHDISNITPNSLRIDLARYIDTKPHTFDFYFRLDDFYAIPEWEDNQQIGHSRILHLKSLPEQIQHSIVEDLKNGRSKILIDGDNDIKSINRRRYLHVRVKSIGVHKAKMEATRMVERCSNICKLVYFNKHIYNILLNKQVPLEYHYRIAETKSIKHGPIHRHSHRLVMRNKALDKMITQLTAIVTKIDKSNLEIAFLNSIDVFGMIEESTPLRVKFNLCMIALESLLIYQGRTGYIGASLAEKVSLLVGDSKLWLAHLYQIKEKTVTRRFIEENFVEGRIRLDDRIDELYSKRSSFSHRGIGNEDGGLRSNDYEDAALILFLVIRKLLKLNEEGILNVGKRNSRDENSLDRYIEKLKYSGSTKVQMVVN